MDMSDLLKKENLQYIGSLIIKASNWFLIMIFLVLILIAVIVDTKLTYTFPAYTLITILVCFLVLAISIYCKKQEDIYKRRADIAVKKQIIAAKMAEQKQIRLMIQQEYDFVEPMLNHLTEDELNLLKPLTQKNTIELTTDNDFKIKQILVKGFYRYITIINYPGIPQPFDVVKVTPLFQEILRKYFNK